MSNKGIGKIFSGMKISTKIILSNIFFLIPMGIMLFISLNGINYDIRFSSLELYGNEYQRPLESLLNYTQDYQRFLLEEDKSKELSDLAKKIDSAFNELDKAQENRGEDLQFTTEGLEIRGREHLMPNLVRGRWADAKSSGNNDDFISLIADIREMITHSGDTSNLILDPDLDSYYLMDLSLLALPQTQDRLGEILIFGKDAFKRAASSSNGNLSDSDKLKFYVYAKMLEESDYSRIKGSTETAVNEDQNFYGLYQPMQSTIPASFDDYENLTLAFISMLYDLGSSSTLNYSLDEFIELGQDTRSQSFVYWNDVVDILDDLLNIRIGNYKQTFYRY
ncbi:MAG: hypothetical protein PQJ46_16645, partial [Spirochaetales bacterium]|nr:hypothetical protein [Spirochaetales bacterium]